MLDTEGLTEDDVTYLWSRKTFDDEAAENAGETPQLKELGKEKTYTVTQEDIGSKDCADNYRQRRKRL